MYLHEDLHAGEVYDLEMARWTLRQEIKKFTRVHALYMRCGAGTERAMARGAELDLAAVALARAGAVLEALPMADSRLHTRTAREIAHAQTKCAEYLRMCSIPGSILNPKST